MPINTVLTSLTLLCSTVYSLGNKGYEAQLYEDLLYDYNKIPRPVKNSTDVLLVDVGASLIRIIDVDEKNQVLTTNVWLEMRWTDIKLQWKPERYGGIRSLHVPISYIWSPDIVLYNNAAGDPDITIFTDAHVSYDGRVYWQPPAIYKSFCSIDVTWFPYDIQNCTMKFGTWSYTGFYVDLRQLPHEKVMMKKDTDGSDIEFMEDGMDLSFFYKSAEWDLLSLTSARHSVLYASCCGPEKYVDITYYFILRRKTLFFTTNLIVPCFLISFLTTFVFCLSDHKITFSISILVTLTVFFLVLIDLMPPTSLIIPMFGRYLTTTLILVSLSTLISVIPVNFRYRSGAAYHMSPWIRQIFLKCLPKLLFMKRPERQPKPVLKKNPNFSTTKLFTQSCASLSSLAPIIMKPQAFSTSFSSKRRSNTSLKDYQQQKSNHYQDISSSYLVSTNGSLNPSRQQCHVSVSFESDKNNNDDSMKNENRKSDHVVAVRSVSNRQLENATELTYFHYPTPCDSLKLSEKEKFVGSIVRTESVDSDLPPLPPPLVSPYCRRQESRKGSEEISLKDSKSLHVFQTVRCPRSKRKRQFAEASTTDANNIPEKIKPPTDKRAQRSTLRSQNSIEAVKMIQQKVNDVIFANLLRQVRFIAEHFRRNEEESEVSDDWTFVAMVLDRLFLIIFGFLNIATFSILLEALYDLREPLNITSAHSTASKPLGVINLSFCSKMQNSS